MAWQELGVVAGGILLIGCFIYIGMSGDEISKRYAVDTELRKKIRSQQKRDDEDDGDKGQSSGRDTAGSAQQRSNTRGTGSSLTDVVEGDEEPGPGASKSTTTRPHQNGHTVQPSKTIPAAARLQQNGHTIPPSKTPPAKSSSAMLPPPVPRSPPGFKPPTFSSMPPPPRPTSGPTTLRPPPSSASQLRVPPQQRLSSTAMQPSSLTPNKPASKSRAVTLTPGHSPLDWAALQSSGKLPSSTSPLLKITPSILKSQTGRKGKAAWTEFRGKVYDVGPYLPFHPGGETELMKGAGRGAESLFMEVHPWVNWEGMLGGCCVGVLVGEGEDGMAKGGLEEMD